MLSILALSWAVLIYKGRLGGPGRLMHCMPHSHGACTGAGVVGYTDPEEDGLPILDATKTRQEPRMHPSATLPSELPDACDSGASCAIRPNPGIWRCAASLLS